MWFCSRAALSAPNNGAEKSKAACFALPSLPAAEYRLCLQYKLEPTALKRYRSASQERFPAGVGLAEQGVGLKVGGHCRVEGLSGSPRREPTRGSLVGSDRKFQKLI